MYTPARLFHLNVHAGKWQIVDYTAVEWYICMLVHHIPIKKWNKKLFIEVIVSQYRIIGEILIQPKIIVIQLTQQTR